MPQEITKRGGCIAAIANVIWFICGGFILGLLWGVLGLILCVTIIGIPFGLQCFKAASLSFAPFGKVVTLHFERHPIINIIWLFIAGWEMFVGYMVAGIVNAITIIGIPAAIQSFKMAKLALFPFGAEIN